MKGREKETRMEAKKESKMGKERKRAKTNKEET